MNGKGWLVIYGGLGIMLMFLFFSQLAINKQSDDLKKEVAALKSVNSLNPPALNNSPAGENLFTPEGRNTKRKNDLNAIKTALKKYYDSKKSYPGSLSELQGIMQIVPSDPGAPKYNYRYAKAGAGFRLTAALEGDDSDDGNDGKKDHTYTLTNK
jgi:hypothetical protein